MPGFDEWESFYVIVGAAAGALIGLQFVVMTLIAERPAVRRVETGAAFMTPTIVHFSAALLVSGLMRMPWHTIAPAAVLCGVTGIAGVIYGIIVARRMTKPMSYKPDFADWMFFVVVPLLGYVVLAASSAEALFHPEEALIGIGAATLVLLFMGIHNAWDSVSYLVFVSMRQDALERQKGDLPGAEE